MVSAVLAHSGHDVDLASDGWEALIRVGRAVPDLVITEVRLPTTDGWSFAERLRSRAEASGVPIVFLASFGPDRTPGRSFRADTDRILAKPFRLEQIEETVRSALGRTPIQGVPIGAPAPVLPVHLDADTFRGPAAVPDASDADQDAGSPRRAVLAGALEQFGLSSVLIVLELERKTGVLILQGREQSGRVWLREGRVLRAEIAGPHATRGSLAVYELLTWNRGRFEFNAGDVDGADEIGSSTSFLILEGARLQDERKQGRPGN